MLPPALRGIVAALLLAGCAAPGPEASAPGASPPGPRRPPSLEPVSSRPIPGDLAALGLTGANKPNGMQYRFRQSVPDHVPDFVPRSLDGLELWIADPAPGGEWLGFYRGAPALSPFPANSPFRAVLFAPGGARRWDLDLNRFLSRPDHLEIQDVRLHEGRLYLNEACQSYSREAGGECSSLLRVDPASGRVDWRTRPLVSNDVLLLHDGYVIAGYGFTAEPDSLFLVEQDSGEVVARHGLDSAHSYLEVVGGRLVVVTRNRVYEFDL